MLKLNGPSQCSGVSEEGDYVQELCFTREGGLQLQPQATCLTLGGAAVGTTGTRCGGSACAPDAAAGLGIARQGGPGRLSSGVPKANGAKPRGLASLQPTEHNPASPGVHCRMSCG